MTSYRDYKDNYDDSHVIDVKVGEILMEVGGGIREGIWAREGKAIDELRPWATVGEGVVDGVGKVGEEEVEG